MTDKEQTLNEFTTLFQNNGQTPGSGPGGKLRPTDFRPWFTKLINKVYEGGLVKSINKQTPDVNGNLNLDLLNRLGAVLGYASFDQLKAIPTAQRVRNRMYAVNQDFGKRPIYYINTGRSEPLPVLQSDMFVRVSYTSKYENGVKIGHTIALADLSVNYIWIPVPGTGFATWPGSQFRVGVLDTSSNYYKLEGPLLVYESLVSNPPIPENGTHVQWRMSGYGSVKAVEGDALPLFLGSPTDNTNVWYQVPETSHSITYAQLKQLATAGQLAGGQYYLISDFQTIHIIPNTTQVNTGPIEPLLVQAINGSTIGHEAVSTVYPTDTIHYDFNNALAENGTTARKGLIIFRKDNKLKISCHYDWRNHKFRRWAVKAPAWSATVTYAANTVVEYGGCLYVALSNSNLNITPNNWDYANWLALWDISTNSTYNNYKAIDRYIATHPANFTIGGYAVPADVNDFADYFTFNSVTGETTKDTINGMNNADKFNNISIAADLLNATLYNNIIFVTAKPLASPTQFKTHSINFAEGCFNMTIGWQASECNFGTFSYNNLFKQGPYQMHTRAWFQDNVFLADCGENIIADDFKRNIQAPGQRIKWNNFERAFEGNRFRGQFTSNNVLKHTSNNDFNHSNANTYDKPLGGVKFMQGLSGSTLGIPISNRTITNSYNHIVVDMQSPSGKLFYKNVSDAGVITPTEFI